jgi:hypothetical protein
LSRIRERVAVVASAKNPSDGNASHPSCAPDVEQPPAPGRTFEAAALGVAPGAGVGPGAPHARPFFTDASVLPATNPST